MYGKFSACSESPQKQKHESKTIMQKFPLQTKLTFFKEFSSYRLVYNLYGAFLVVLLIILSQCNIKQYTNTLIVFRRKPINIYQQNASNLMSATAHTSEG